MEDLEHDLAYLMGRYLAVARKMEKELDRLARKENDSIIEQNFDDFEEQPAQALAACQEHIIHNQVVLAKMGRPQLPQELSEIFREIDVKELEGATLNAPSFLHGYHKQLATYD